MRNKSVTIENLVASAARTASGAGGAESLFGDFDELLLIINVTAVSGTTPTLVVNYQVSYDGVDWVTHTATGTINATGNTLLNLTGIGQIGRISWTIGGTTPSFTFDVHAILKRRGM